MGWGRLMAYLQCFKTRRVKEKEELEKVKTRQEQRLKDWIEQLNNEVDLIVAQQREAPCDRQHRSS
jgi:hypothetical protein